MRPWPWCVFGPMVLLLSVSLGASSATMSQSTPSAAGAGRDDSARVPAFECVAATNQGTAPTTPALLHLRVTTYDYAGIRSEIEFGQSLANQIFRPAGVSIDWQPTCGASGSVYVNVITETMATTARVSPFILGYTHVDTLRANVLWERVRATALKQGVTPAALLAYVMAHEIAHVLLPSSSHEDHGLMAVNINLSEVRMRGLSLTPRQVQMIQQRLRGGVISTK